MSFPNKNSQQQKKTIKKKIGSYAHYNLDIYPQTQKTLGALTTNFDSISALQKESVLLIPNPLIRFYTPRMSQLSLRRSENPNQHLQPKSSQLLLLILQRRKCHRECGQPTPEWFPAFPACAGSLTLTAPLPWPSQILGMGIPAMCWFAAIKWQQRRSQS